MTSVEPSSGTPPPAGPPPVSEGILLPLRQVASRRRRTRVCKGLLQFGVLALCLLLLTVVLLGMFPGMPVALRVGLAALGYAAMGTTAWQALRHAFGKTTLAGAARHAERALPELEERLSSAVELAQEPDARFRGSPVLIAQLTRQAERQAANIAPEQVVSGRQVLLWLAMLAPVGALWLMVWALMPGTVSRGLAGAIQPWKFIPPPGIVLQVTPGALEMPAGDPLEISVGIDDPDGLTRRHPIDRVTLLTRYGGQTVSRAMELVDPATRTFHHVIDNTQQDFDYRISTPLAESETYHVQVLPRPAVAGLEISYSYPPYTRLVNRTELSRDGAITAVVGTQVKLVVHATQKLTPESCLILGLGATGPAALPLTPTAAGNDYQATFTVERSMPYVIRLISQNRYHEGTVEKPLTNKDDQPRPLVAQPDLPPSIAILSPADKLHVRPTDLVPIKWQAGDDFGLARVQMLIEVDHRDTETPDVPFTTTDPTKAGGEFVIDVQRQLTRHGLWRGYQIAYQLKATDNCPTPHTALSARQILRIDMAADSLATRQDKAAAWDLQEALAKAREQIADAQRRVQELSRADKNYPLTPEQRQQARATTKGLEELQKQLTAAAKDKQETSYKDAAAKLQDIAEKPVHRATDDLARAQLSADEPAARREPLEDAARQLAQARQALDELQQQLRGQQQQTDLTDALRDLAAQQKALADALRAGRPGEAGKLAQQQQEVQQKLDAVIQHNPELQKPVAQGAQPQVDELLKRLAEIQDKQRPLAERTQARADAQEAYRDLLKQQEKLNGAIGTFARQSAEARKPAAAAAPAKEDLEAISRDLAQGKFDAAAAHQEQAAKTLTETGSRLAPAQQAAQGAAQKAQADLPRAQQLAARTQELQEKARELSQEIKEAHRQNQPPTRPGDPANQHAGQLADAVAKAAEELARQNPAAKAEAAAAAQQAADAKQDAADGQAARAQHALSSAAKKLEEAAGRQAAAAQEAIARAQGPQGQPAAQAQDLAQRQRQLAQATRAAARALEQTKPDPQRDAAAQSQQRQVAGQIEQDAQAAAALRQQTQGTAPQVAQDAGTAAHEMQSAAAAQRHAADAGQKNDVPAANKAQHAATEALARAAEALRGIQQLAQGSPRPPTGAPAPGTPEAQPPSPGQSGQPPAGQAQSGQAQNGSAQSGQAQSAPGTASAAGTPATGTGSAAPGAMDRVAQDVQKAHAAAQQAAKGDAMAAGKAAEALADAAGALGGTEPGGVAAEQEPGTGQGQAGQSGKSGTGQGQASAGSTPGTPGGQPGSGPPGTGQSAGMAGAQPGQPVAKGGSGGGVQVQATASADGRPAAVKEVGIAPGDWARLPPQMQQQLLNAAQQKGPPGYQEMIKNYYVRIARLQAQEGK